MVFNTMSEINHNGGFRCLWRTNTVDLNGKTIDSAAREIYLTRLSSTHIVTVKYTSMRCFFGLADQHGGFGWI